MSAEHQVPVWTTREPFSVWAPVTSPLFRGGHSIPLFFIRYRIVWSWDMISVFCSWATDFTLQRNESMINNTRVKQNLYTFACITMQNAFIFFCEHRSHQTLDQILHLIRSIMGHQTDKNSILRKINTIELHPNGIPSDMLRKGSAADLNASNCNWI